ncbi:MAG: hypothetical protein LBD34_00930 [Puniceicoccales bacterium]|jgi:hypothetical protein|nr:hypothetical protein [Puniceicoccales bacterium]
MLSIHVWLASLVDYYGDTDFERFCFEPSLHSIISLRTNEQCPVFHGILLAIDRCFFNREIQKIYCALTRHRKMQKSGESYDILAKPEERGHFWVTSWRHNEAVA